MYFQELCILCWRGRRTFGPSLNRIPIESQVYISISCRSKNFIYFYCPHQEYSTSFVIHVCMLTISNWAMGFLCTLCICHPKLKAQINTFPGFFFFFFRLHCNFRLLHSNGAIDFLIDFTVFCRLKNLLYVSAISDNWSSCTTCSCIN